MFRFLTLADLIVVGVIVGVAMVLYVVVLTMPVGNEGVEKQETEQEHRDI